MLARDTRRDKERGGEKREMLLYCDASSEKSTRGGWELRKIKGYFVSEGVAELSSVSCFWPCESLFEHSDTTPTPLTPLSNTHASGEIRPISIDTYLLFASFIVTVVTVYLSYQFLTSLSITFSTVIL